MMLFRFILGFVGVAVRCRSIEIIQAGLQEGFGKRRVVFARTLWDT